MRSNEIGERINEFIGLASEYLFYGRSKQEMDSIFQRDRHKRGGQAAVAAELGFKFYEKIQELEAKLVPYGYALAEQIEGISEDSSALLKLLHCATAGGPEYVVPVWVDVKVGLQRIIIRHGEDGAIVDELVTLDQVAPLTGLTKRTLDGHLRKGNLPKPDVKGGGGKAHKWNYQILRPSLALLSRKILPKKFPGSRILPSDTI